MGKTKKAKKKGVKKQKKRKVVSIRLKMNAIIIGVVIIGLIVLGVTSFMTGRQMIAANYEQMALELLKANQESVINELEKYSFIPETLRKSDSAVRLNEGIQFRNALLSSFKEILSVQEDISSMYVATPNKKFYLRPVQELSADYDPSIRPWYLKAVAEDRTVWTDPYVNATDKQVIITAATTVYNADGEFNGVIGIDVDLGTISKKLAKIKIGETGFVTMLDPEYKYMAHPNTEMIGVQMEHQAILRAMGEAPFGKLMANVDGVDYLVIFSTVEEYNWTTLAFVEMNEINSMANGLVVNIALVGLIVVLASIVLTLIYSGIIVRKIHKLRDSMQVLSKGDLTVSSHIHGNDELKELSDSFNVAVSNVRELIVHVEKAVEDVNDSAVGVASMAEETSATADEVSRSVEEIAQGAQDQAGQSEHAAKYTKDLADRITDLNGKTGDMIQSSQSVEKANNDGMSAITDLNTKTNESDEANKEINEKVLQLTKQTESVYGILDAITAISDQTSLLALNASIEAARAGEHGRGFAVVAEEIRKLADESAGSTDEIRRIIQAISADSKATVEGMSKLQSITDEQHEAVNHVNEQFNNISQAIDVINMNIDGISDSVGSLNDAKEEIVHSIENISAVSEETAAASEEVTASVDQQTEAIDEVAKSAESLSVLAKNLRKVLDEFKI